MDHKEFLNELQKSCHVDSHQCATLLSALQKILAQAAIEQIPVNLPGLGTFVSHKHPEYIQENPLNGEQTLYPPRMSYRMQYEAGEQPTGQHDKLIDDDLAEYTQSSVELAHLFLDSMAKIITRHVIDRDEVTIHGIGNFHLIEAHQSGLQRIAFTPDDQMRSLVNAPFNCFEPVIISSAKEVVSPNVAPTEDEALPAVTPSEEEPLPAVTIPLQPSLAEAHPNNPESFTPETKDKQTMDEPRTPVVENNQQQAEKASSSNAFLYTFISIILAACLAFGIYIFILYSNSSDFSQDTSVQEDEYVEEQPIENEPNEPVYSEEEMAEDEAILSDDDAILSDEVLEPESVAAGSENVTAPTEVAATEAPAATSPAPVAKTVEPDSPYHRQRDAQGNYVTIVLQQGDRLTTVAQKYLGESTFWPYIFEVNSDKLKKPDLIQAGMKLYLPDPKYYDMKPGNAASLQKARNYSAKFLK